jgi:hypothetical protein
LVPHIREEPRLRVFENRVLRKEGRKWWEVGEKCMMRSFVASMLYQIIFRS